MNINAKNEAEKKALLDFFGKVTDIVPEKPVSNVPPKIDNKKVRTK